MLKGRVFEVGQYKSAISEQYHDVLRDIYAHPGDVKYGNFSLRDSRNVNVSEVLAFLLYIRNIAY
jgi:hypothetical protein